MNGELGEFIESLQVAENAKKLQQGGRLIASSMNRIVRSLYTWLTHEYCLYAIALAIFVGTYYARAAVSIGTGVLAVVGIMAILQKGKLKLFVTDRASLALTSVFLIYLFSGIMSSDHQLWQERLITNIPYLVLPIGIWAYGPLKRTTLTHVVFMFIAVTSVSALILMVGYMINFQEYNAYYKVGKTIPTPIMHVRYSFFLALGSVLGIGLLLDGIDLDKARKGMIAGMSVFLLICVHVLAVRTGLLSLYGGILIIAGVVMIRRKNWRLSLGIIGLLAVLLIGGVSFLPSMKNKLGYMMYDLRMLRDQGVSPDYSDNIRITSIRHGLKIFADNPVFGVGIGDVADEMERGL